MGPDPRSPGGPYGKRFAAHNPRAGPYDWFAWSAESGPHVTPHVSATQVYELVDATIDAARATQPDMADAVPDAAPGPWQMPENPGDSWWPKLA